ncbi:MarR family transcriptional regulator [Chromohalobacter marismortui]|uniref:MarR family transcriptional regulator n=1 Tax=Chromohalobacter marismortui TaxID=42055 RepID=A0A4R7NT64_9GAMM|nr:MULTISPECIES: MarR family transcriptional regulator [Chromohalobacter]MCI0509238.1 MarR family transcriptional regulator [Chromohalobacter sp.]MCI0592097.1 MarR family transcriptional regulator [Chromohalobacter sp.]TDU23869.1 MarR family transcriptional regulator [Chromohalobacter marismortui]
MPPKSVVWQQVRNVFESVENQVAKALQREHGLGLTEYRALHLLSTAPDSELRMQELANRLGLNQSSVTRLVERMERNQYTIRDMCPDDKRGVYTVITSRGRQIQEEAGKNYDAFLEAALDEVGSQTANSDIVACLRKMIQEAAA